MDLELDISLAHPWSNGIEVLSATSQRAAATRRENLKIKMYDQELLPGGFDQNLCLYSSNILAVGERKLKTIGRNCHSYQGTKTESQMHRPSRHTGDLCFLCVYND